MIKIFEYPFIRLLLPFCAGIFLALFNPVFQPAILGWITVSLFILLIASRFVKLNYTDKNGQGLLLVLLLFCLGYLITYYHDLKKSSNFFDKYSSQKFLQIEISKEFTSKVNSWRTEGKVIAVGEPGHWQKTSGNILVYFLKSGNGVEPQLHYGQVIVVNNNAMLIPGAAWPDGFDFSHVMRYRNIYHQLFLKEGQFVITDKKSRTLAYGALQLRDLFNKILEAEFEQKEIYGMLQSLVFGFKENLDPEDYKSFVNTGTVHVLAVSGMHISLLFWLLGIILLKPFEKTWILFQTFSVCIIVFFWSYALITGFSPSVVRATLMFSIVIVGRMIHRKLNILNSVYSSAFILLVYNPYYLIDVGFQLSYLAVLGIVYINPKIVSLFSSRWWLVHKSWELMSVSLAAQIGTLPVTLYFFKQFPSYFLLSNLVIIPLTNIMLIICVSSFLLKFIPFLWPLIKWTIVKLTLSLFAVVHYFEHIPGALLQNIKIDEWQSVFLLAIVVLIVLYLWQPSGYKIASFIAILCLWFSHNVYKSYLLKTQQFAYVAELKGHLVLEIGNGSSVLVFSDSNFIRNSDKFSYLFKDHFNKRNIKDFKFVDILSLSKTGYLTANIKGLKTRFYSSFDSSFIMNNNSNIRQVFLADQEKKWSHLDKYDVVVIRKRFLDPKYSSLKGNIIVLNNNFKEIF